MTRDPRHALGDLGEDLAAAHLEDEGWSILERNWSCREGELDLIAERGETIAFVEVRTVSDTSRQQVAPELTVTRAKRAKLIKAARRWIGARAIRRRIFRFDVIAIVHGDAVALRHYPNAFVLDQGAGGS